MLNIVFEVKEETTRSDNYGFHKSLVEVCDFANAFSCTKIISKAKSYFEFAISNYMAVELLLEIMKTVFGYYFLLILRKRIFSLFVNICKLAISIDNFNEFFKVKISL